MDQATLRRDVMLAALLSAVPVSFVETPRPAR